MTEASLPPVAAMTPQDQEGRDEALNSRTSITSRTDSSSEISKHQDDSGWPSGSSDPAYELPAYSTLGADPDGPKIAETFEFRNRDPYCPDRYQCKDYDHDAVWFDGTNEADLRFTIDLEEGSMDRLPDIRPYLYYVGYWGHWEVKGAVPPSTLNTLDRAGIEEMYVRMGRAYLLSERAKGRGYFLAKRDWPALAEEYGPMPWRIFWENEDDLTDEDVGMDDLHANPGLDGVTMHTLKTNIRASMSDKDQVKVRQGDRNWDLYIQWLYSNDVHGIEQITFCHCTVSDVYKERYSRALSEVVFMRHLDEDELDRL